ncbi:MAG: metallophosphoesterase [Magnetococcales bacterium]|nr:metallophosphoesterase [Magnetococcales bacterium]NGZ05292.1 metallophosphoesterase [Magnetococcales bacterium]
MIGRHEEDQTLALQLSTRVAKRHLILEHRKDHLLIRDLDTDTGSLLYVQPEPEQVERLGVWRLSCLQEIRRLFGGPLRPLDARTALERLRHAHAIQRAIWAPGSPDAAPAIIHLPVETQPILVGDLHEHLDNLLTVLTTGGGLRALEERRAVLVLLGDAVHPDGGSDLTEMSGSLLMMDLIFALMIRFPGRVVYIRGNHDGCDEEISKRGISQGRAWRHTMIKTRGEEYLQAMLNFYQDLPSIVVHPRVVACHAAPFTVPVNRKTLGNLRAHPELLRQLTWNRIHQPNRPGGYRKADVKRFLTALTGSDRPALVVGHTPLDDRHTFWLNIDGISNHHILYGGHARRMGWITLMDERLLAQEYPVEPLSQELDTC